MRIPRDSATGSTGLRPGQSERSDAGGALLLGGGRRGQLGSPALAHGLALEGDAVGVVHEAVEDGVGEGWVADDLVPVLDRQLAGEERRALAVADIEQLQQVAPGGGGLAACRT